MSPPSSHPRLGPPVEKDATPARRKSLWAEAELSDRHISTCPQPAFNFDTLHTQTESTQARKSKLIGQADCQLRLVLTDLIPAGRTAYKVNAIHLKLGPDSL